ncbi:MAG: S-layer homology domain-containing protein [Clostridia bacterium]|jgi:hypothetical protein|nr:S-layer homology domain-containing protein [Clostridia bacterium]
MKRIKKILFMSVIMLTCAFSLGYADEDPDYSAGKNDGEEIAIIEGAEKATLDFKAGNENDFKAARDTERELIERLDLEDEDRKYKDGFWDGYKEKFEEEYKETYRTLRLTKFKDADKTGTSTTEKSDGYKSVDMFGGAVLSPDTVVTLAVPEGAVFLNNKFKMESSNNDYAVIDTQRYIKVTNVYTIIVEDAVNLYKPAPLKFKYAGPDSAGIYRLVKNKWEYQPSTIADGTISADITDDIFGGGRFVVLIDKTTMLSDISDSWAKSEIEYSLKNGYLQGYEDKTFRASNNLTRAEMLVIFNRIFNWPKNTLIDLTKYEDGIIVKAWSSQEIRNAIGYGIIKGYADNTIRPNREITYQEIEWILRRALKKDTFRWNTVAEKMLEEKQILCESFESMSNRIKRGEVAYLLYLIKTNQI